MTNEALLGGATNNCEQKIALCHKIEALPLVHRMASVAGFLAAVIKICHAPWIIT
jgi:hypothetical protein